MKFTFFKRKKEREELKLRCAILEQEKEDLLRSLATVRLSKDTKIDSLVEELSFLRNSSKKEREHYESQLKFYSEMQKRTDEKQNVQSEEIEKLRKRNEELKLLIPTEFPVEKIMDSCANAAWYGNHSKSTRTFESLDGKVKLIFAGTVYEPSYEYFTAGCCVYYQEEGMPKRKSLYTVDSRNVAAYRNEEITTGSKESVREYLVRKNLGFKEV